MSIQWTESIDGLDWEELAALYRAAPLGDKKPADLKGVFANSMFRCLAFADGKVVAAGRALADGRDCAYLCDIAVLPSHQGRGLGRSRALIRNGSWNASCTIPATMTPIASASVGSLRRGDSQTAAPGSESPSIEPVLGQAAVTSRPSSRRTSARKRL